MGFYKVWRGEEKQDLACPGTQPSDSFLVPNDEMINQGKALTVGMGNSVNFARFLIYQSQVLLVILFKSSTGQSIILLLST